MKPACLLFTILFFCISAVAQDEIKVFEKVEIVANTDLKAWTSHIKQKTQLPDSFVNIIPAGTYKAIIQFIIDVHGNVGQIRLLEDPGFGLGEIAVAAFKSYKGKWTPAIQCGRLVSSYRKQSVSFVVPPQL